MTAVTPANVHNLRRDWTFSTATTGTEDYPVVVGGIAYVTTAGARVYALDGATGRLLWTWIPLKSAGGRA
jgi:glucose dehydrogenase